MVINRTTFHEKLTADQPLLLDGAMGTMLYRLGAALDRPLCLLNRDTPQLVAQVHRAYIDAGADIIETNTFDANRFKLGKHGLADQTAALNAQAVSIARRVISGAFRPVLLAGSVGPLAVTMAPLGRITQREVRAALSEQLEALLHPPDSQGVDLIIIETQTNLREVETAVDISRDLAPHVPIVTQMTFNRDDRTLLGDTATQVAVRLHQLGVDALGVNCSSGPAQLLRLLTTMHRVLPTMPLAAAPNAGWPEETDGGRVFYPATPSYFADYVGAFRHIEVRLIGGCCGTTAEHIAAMRTALDHPEAHPPTHVIQVHSPSAGHEQGAILPPDQPTRLARALEQRDFVVAVEMTPPHGTAVQKLLASARSLHEAGATFLSVADMPQARMRMSAWAAGHLIQQNLGVETILHFPTRGRDLLRIQADLLAAHAVGLRNLFVTMGERAKVGDYPEAEDHYDIMPSGLIQLIKAQLNAGVDQLQRTLDQPTHFIVGCGVNLNPANPAREARLLHEQVINGADFAFSSLVFDVEQAHAFLEQYRQTYGSEPLPVIAAIQPLYNANMTEYLHHERLGVTIPEPYRQAMRLADNEWQGVSIAQEVLLGLRELVQGVVIVPYNGRYDLAADVLDALDVA